MRDRQDASQDQLFPVRLVTREMPPEGAHVRIVARADDGRLYFCKDDRGGIPCRMREAFFSMLAGQLNLTTPDFRVVEDEGTGETFFGSRQMPSTATAMALKRFLRTERKDELGRHLPFPGRWFSQLYAYDLFAGNWDRSADNFIALQDGQQLRLRPIDFSAAELGISEVDRFPDGQSETVQVGRKLRTVHSFFPDSASQTIKLIEAVPRSVVKGFFDSMPTEWINADERERIDEFWSGPLLAERLEALRSGLTDGQLL